MNKSEEEFRVNAESRGCKVLRSGWPDFAVIGPDGSLFCVEVKTGGGLNKAQREMIQFLTLVGIPCYMSLDGDFPDLKEPMEFPDLKKPKKLPDLKKFPDLKKITEECKRIVERDYHHRVEIVEEKLRQIIKICEDRI